MSQSRTIARSIAPIAAAFGLLVAAGCSTEPAPGPAPEAAPTPSTPDFQGALNSVDCDAIIGWAWDRNRPNTPIRVDIYDGDTLLTTVDADLERTVLVQKGRGNGKHGFRLATPASLKDGKPHRVGARYAGTSSELDPPETLTCGPDGKKPAGGATTK